MSKRVFLLGLDGADEYSVGKAVRDGIMPTFARLVQNKIHPLRSTPLPITPAAWTAAYTGMNPAKTGVLTWERRTISYRTRLVNSSDVGANGFHTRVAEAGKRVLSVGFPMMCPPPDAPNSIYLSGWDATPGAPLCNDPVWLGRIGEFGYTLDAEFTTDEHELANGIRSRFAIMRALVNERPWDCAMLYLGFIDGLGHRIGFGNELTQKMLALTDKELERFVGEIGDDFVFLTCSDHGFGQFPRVFSVQQWLEQAGYLKLRGRQFRAGDAGGIRSVQTTDLENGLIDWSSTRAFCTEAIGQYAAIAINTKGFFAGGIVSPRDVFSLSNELAAAIEGASDPDSGQRLVNRVFRREELFWGRYISEFPELYVETVADTAAYVGKRKAIEGGFELEEGYVHHGKFNSHYMDGMIGASFEISGIPQIEDVAPTVYSLLGVPTPSDVDGSNLSGARSEFVAIQAAAEQTPYSADEEEMVRKRLEDLGYLG